MFKKNNQPELFTFENKLLNNEQQQALGKTPEKAFCTLKYSSIIESDFKFLFLEKGSPLNVQLNVLVSALILKERKSLSYDELMSGIMFDLRTKIALVLTSSAVSVRRAHAEGSMYHIDTRLFSRVAIFNCQNRMAEHEEKTTPTGKRNKAVFEIGKYASCPLLEQCNTFNNNGIYCFTHQDYLQYKRTMYISDNSDPLFRMIE